MLLGGVGLGLLAAAPWLLRSAPAIGRGAQTMWNLGRGMGTAGGRKKALEAAWGAGRPANTTAAAQAPRGAGGRFTGPRMPDQPAVPRGAVNRASDWYRSQPKWKQAAMNVGGGLGAMALWPEFDEEGVPRGQGIPGGLPGGVPGGGGPSAMGGDPSALPSYAERLKSRRSRYLDNMSMVVKHSMLLQFQNPGRKNSYMKDAINMLKVGAMQENEIELAEMTDEVFKDNKVPMSARTVYRRMLKAGASPREASQVSGYILEIEKTEAKSAADLARSQPKLSDMYSKDAIMLAQVQAMYATSPEAAIKQLADWLMTGVLDLSEQYTGYKPQTQADYLRMAGEILSGTGGGGVSGVGAPSGEVYDISTK